MNNTHNKIKRAEIKSITSMVISEAETFGKPVFEDIAKKFFCCAKQFEKDAYICWQVRFKADGNFSVFAFSNTDIKYDDYKWIFAKGAKLQNVPLINDDMFDIGKITYSIISKTQPIININEIAHKFYNMLPVLNEAEATIQIMARSTGDGKTENYVDLGINEKLSFRLRTAFFMAFPSCVFYPYGNDSEMMLPNDSIGESAVDYMQVVINALHYKSVVCEALKPEKDCSFYDDLDDEILLKDDLPPTILCPKIKNINYLEELNNLVGLNNVKNQVKRIIAFAKMQKSMMMAGDKVPKINLAMEFAGNPGTAKTTVARILAGVFAEAGIVSSNELIEVGRADLVARYEGQTAEKVRNVFSRARGKVLFIDEAYSLLECHHGEFGDEAINTIVQEMENHRHDTVVIFAGYPKEMTDFIERNPGLRSRVPFRIVFEDYLEEEMWQILNVEAANIGFEIDVNAKEKLIRIFKNANKSETGNGRLCRNLVENAVLSFALRTCGGEKNYKNDAKRLLKADDFTDDTVTSPAKNKRIGFSI